MRPQWLVGIVIGILLIYVGAFGTSGLGLGKWQLTGTPENFTTWTEVDQGGYLTVTSTSVTATSLSRSAMAYVYKDFGVGYLDTTAKFQFECQLTSISADWHALYVMVLSNNFGASAQMISPNSGFSILRKPGPVYSIEFGTSYVLSNPTQKLYVYMTRTSTEITANIYTDSSHTTLLTTMKQVDLAASANFRYIMVQQSAGVSGATQMASGYTANLIVSKGGVAPPPEDKGNLKVIGYYDGNPVQCVAYYTFNSQQSSQVTVPTSGYTWSSLTLGSYTVTGTYGSTTDIKMGTLVAGQTVTVQLSFGGKDPDPVEDDPLAKLMAWINSSSIRTIMLIGGLGLTGISGIMFIVPEKKHYAEPAPPRYYS